MKVVLDTNVIIAAFAARGLCADLYELCLADHQVITSTYILDEVGDKLLKKLRLPASRVADIRRYLEGVATVVVPVEVAAETCRDADDLPVIGTALAALADVLATGDDDLLTLGSVESVRIVTPRRFWEMLQCKAPFLQFSENAERVMELDNLDGYGFNVGIGEANAGWFAAIKKGKIEWHRHALARMLERGISRQAVKQVLLEGEIIESYQSDCPYPSALIFGTVDGEPLHVVAAFDKTNGIIYIITAYRPDQIHFLDDYRTRR